MPKPFHAVRFDCAHMGRPVFLSGVLEGLADGRMELRAFRCSHRGRCGASRCVYGREAPLPCLAAADRLPAGWPVNW